MCGQRRARIYLGLLIYFAFPKILPTFLEFKPLLQVIYRRESIKQSQAHTLNIGYRRGEDSLFMGGGREEREENVKYGP